MKKLKPLILLIVPGALIAWLAWKYFQWQKYNDAWMATGAPGVSFLDYLRGK